MINSYKALLSGNKSENLVVVIIIRAIFDLNEWILGTTR